MSCWTLVFSAQCGGVFHVKLCVIPSLVVCYVYVLVCLYVEFYVTLPLATTDLCVFPSFVVCMCSYVCVEFCIALPFLVTDSKFKGVLPN